MRWKFWKKKEPTLADVLEKIVAEGSKIAELLQDPDTQDSLKSFANGVMGLGKDLNETKDIIKGLISSRKK